MATNCTNCGCSKLKCGCQDQALTTPIVYPTPAPCPTPEPCSEAFDSQCVYFTKGDILCGTDIVVYQDDTVEDALIQIVDYFCGGESASVTLTDAGTGTHESLVNDGTGPTLATKGLKAGNAVSLSSTGTDITITNDAPDQVVSLTAGADVSITGTYPNFTITNTAPAVPVVLTSAGGSQTLVNDGTGPSLATKGLSSGKGITLTSSATDVTIVAAVSKYVTPGIAAGSTVNFAHGLNTTYIVVSARGGVTGLVPVIYGATGFTYTIIDPTQMSVTNNTADNIFVTIIG